MTGYSGQSTASGAGIDDNIVEVTFSEIVAGNGDTDAIPDVTLNLGTLIPPMYKLGLVVSLIYQVFRCWMVRL